MRLKIDKVASKTVYLTKDASEGVRAQKKKMNQNSELKLTAVTNSLDDVVSPKPQSQIFDPSSTFGEITMTIISQDPSLSTQVDGRLSSLSEIRSTGSPPPRIRKESDFICIPEEKPEKIGGEEKPEKVAEEIKEESGTDSEDHLLPKEETKTATQTTGSIARLPKTKKVKKTTVTMFCERITVKGAIWGEIEISEEFLHFRPIPGERPQDELYELGSIKDNWITSNKKKNWSFQKIKQVHHRRYNHIRCAFEIFTNDNKSYYFNVFSSAKLKIALTELKQRCKDAAFCSRESFANTDLTKRWQEGKISNFEYLMQLNLYAGRSFNDLSQYPVFPWIIADYRSEELNIHTQDVNEQKKIFRDLSLPMGALTEERREAAKTKFFEALEIVDVKEEEVEAMDSAKFDQMMKTVLQELDVFMYGSHYSTGGHIIDYLVRLEPFTSLQIKLQSGAFDEANRIFSSIPKAWDAYLMGHNTQNYKELVPEFFYCPNFLKNK